MTSVDVAASTRTGVGAAVVSFPELPPPREWLFKTAASPTRSVPVSQCYRSSARFATASSRPARSSSRSTAWEPARRLAFDVVQSPLPMQEWSPYAKVYAAHLDNGFRSRRGEFRLIPLPNGGNASRGAGGTG